MYLTSGRGKNSFITDLKRNMGFCRTLYISTAYISISGLLDLEELFSSIDKIYILVGDYTLKSCQQVYCILYQNELVEDRYKQAVNRLKKYIQQKRLNISFYTGSPETKIIHSKIYLLELKNRKYIGYIGSANLTYPGFYKNKESMVRFEDYETINGVYLDFLKEWGIINHKRIQVTPLIKENFNSSNIPKTISRSETFTELKTTNKKRGIFAKIFNWR